MAPAVAGHEEAPIMSNKRKAAGARKRHVPQHRKEPSWTVSDLSALPSGLGVKIVVAGVAGATLAIPATSAFASPSSIAIPMRPSSPLITFTRVADQRGAVPRAAQPAGSAILASANTTQPTAAQPAGGSGAAQLAGGQMLTPAGTPQTFGGIAAGGGIPAAANTNQATGGSAAAQTFGGIAAGGGIPAAANTNQAGGGTGAGSQMLTPANTNQATSSQMLTPANTNQATGGSAAPQTFDRHPPGGGIPAAANTNQAGGGTGSSQMLTPANTAQSLGGGMLASVSPPQPASAMGGAAQSLGGMQAPASTPASGMQAPAGAPVTVANSGGFTSSDPSATSDPVVVATGASNFSGGGFLVSSGSFPVSG